MVIVDKFNNPPVAADALKVGEVYRCNVSGILVMLINITGFGHRVIDLATGQTVSAPSRFNYRTVDAQLVVQ